MKAPWPNAGAEAPRAAGAGCRVILVVGDFPPAINGIGDYSAQLARALAARHHRVAVVTSATTAAGARWTADGVDVRRAVSAWTLRHAGEVLRALGPLEPGSIVHFQYPSPSYRRNVMINLLPALLRARQPQVRVVVTVHEFRLQSPQWRARVLPMLLGAHGLIFADPDDQPRVSRWTFATRPSAATIPIGSNITPGHSSPWLRSEWRRELGVEPAEPLAVYFGELYEHKGIFELLESVKRVRARGLPLRLLVVSGSRTGTADYTERARRRVQEAAQQGWTTVCWNLPPEMVSRSLQAADVAVFPFTRGATRQRGSLIAAICHHLPTITTDGPMTPRGFADEFGVRLVPARDEEALSRTLQHVLTSERERERLRRAAAAASEHFSWDRIAGETAAFYAGLWREPVARRTPVRARRSATSTAKS